MASEKFQKLRKELEALQGLLRLNLDNWDPRTRPGVEGKRNAAKERIPALEAALSNEILTNSSTILVDRDYSGTKELVESAKKRTDINVVLDYLNIEKGMFKQIFEGKKSLSFNSETVERMNLLIIDVGDAIEASSMPVIKVPANAYGSVATRQDMIQKMEQAIEDTYGSELKTLFLAMQLRTEVVKRLSADSLSVLIVNVPKKYAGALSKLTGRTQFLSNDNSEDAGKTTKAAPRLRKKKEASGEVTQKTE